LTDHRHKHPPSHRSRLVTLREQGNSNNEAMGLRGFVPKGVLQKFFTAVGGPIAASALAAGVAGGAVSDEELKEVNDSIDITMGVQSEEEIGEKWINALEDEKWYLKNLGNLIQPLVVKLVLAMQAKTQEQAKQMQWINEKALPIIQDSQEVVNVLGGEPLKLNNTRAKYEDDRDIWVASMDVYGGQDDENKKIGLVNTYFTPSDEVKILVVEIDDISYNLTWTKL